MTKLLNWISFICIFLLESSKHWEEIQFSLSSLFFFHFLLFQKKIITFFQALVKNQELHLMHFYLPFKSLYPYTKTIVSGTQICFRLQLRGMNICLSIRTCLETFWYINLNQCSLIRIQFSFGWKMTFKLNWEVFAKSFAGASMT